MANSSLYGKVTFTVPDHICEKIRLALENHPTAEGAIRARTLVSGEPLTYSNAKRIKNYLEDSANYGRPGYDLAGGRAMLAWLNKELGGKRQTINRSKTVRASAGLDNMFRRSHQKLTIKLPKFSLSKQKLPTFPRLQLMEDHVAEQIEDLEKINLFEWLMEAARMGFLKEAMDELNEIRKNAAPE